MPVLGALKLPGAVASPQGFERYINRGVLTLTAQLRAV